MRGNCTALLRGQKVTIACILLLTIICTCSGLQCGNVLQALLREKPIEHRESVYDLHCTNERCVLYVYLEKSYREASNLCRKLTGNLRLISTNETIYYDTWAGIQGIKAIDTGLDMAWMTDMMETPEIEYWHTMEPNRHPLDQCAVLQVSKGKRWVTKSCERRFFFLCDFDLSNNAFIT
ncbi:hypothetical protein PHET_09196 [Paragonimus heterotremus]|uniref:C-type lectin domain-containing protein n=1 Tax=Paragonimus heterotremus TaxID=100268 RepID=A0A8J4ST41_9TREM|nr:hypothetical protein PHET_09196 [Paragonimus heterotremus]